MLSSVILWEENTVNISNYFATLLYPFDQQLTKFLQELFNPIALRKAKLYAILAFLSAIGLN